MNPGPAEPSGFVAAPRPPSRGRVWRRLRLGLRRLLATRDHPARIARGVSLGLFIALTPTLGLQILLTLLACPLLRANRMVAMPMLAITNPLTIAPFLWIWYRTGLVITGQTPMEFRQFEGLLPSAEAGLFESSRVLLVSFGAPLWIGAFLMASLVAGAAYPLVLLAARRRAESRRLRWSGSSQLA